jgi:hypothetical protein
MNIFPFSVSYTIIMKKISVLTFLFSLTDGDFKEKLIRNVKKEVSLFITVRDCCELIPLLYYCMISRNNDLAPFVSF